MSRHPLRIGLTGLGGYAAHMCDRMLADGAMASPRVRLVAICDPEVDRFPERVAFLRERGIMLLSDFDELLAQDVEAICLPIPIDLHRTYTEAALRAGKGVLCEKPAAGCVDDVDSMIAVRDAVGLPVAIGYQDIYQPAVHELKRRLLRGDFGVVLSASVIGCWPRGDRYFRRNTWAGRYRRNGRWVLDSPANNALAHYIHLALFLMGPSEREAALPDEVEAELYRANRIENYDTCSLRLTFDGGAHALIGFTHACDTAIEPEVVIRCEGAVVRYLSGRRIEIATESVTERLPLIRNPHKQMFETLNRWMRSGASVLPGGTLETARAHTVAINAASQCAAVADIPAEFIETSPDEKGAPLRSVRGLVAAMRESIGAGRMLHESGLVPWSSPAGQIDARGYCHFPGPAGFRQEAQPLGATA